MGHHSRNSVRQEFRELQTTESEEKNVSHLIDCGIDGGVEVVVIGRWNASTAVGLSQPHTRLVITIRMLKMEQVKGDSREPSIVDNAQFHQKQHHNCASTKFEPVNDNLVKKCACPYERPTLRTEDLEKKRQQQLQQVARNQSSEDLRSLSSNVAEDIRNANVSSINNNSNLLTTLATLNCLDDSINNNNSASSSANRLVCDSDLNTSSSSNSSIISNASSNQPQATTKHLKIVVITTSSSSQQQKGCDDDVRNNNNNNNHYQNDKPTVITKNHNISSSSNSNSRNSGNQNSVCGVPASSSLNSSSTMPKSGNEGRLLSNCLSALNFVSGGSRSAAGGISSTKATDGGSDGKKLCDHCCKKKTGSSNKSAKLCKNCRLHNCSVQNCKESTGNATTTKSKRGNWSLRFNCAKLKGSKSSSSSKVQEQCSCSSSSAEEQSAETSRKEPQQLTPENLHKFIGEQASLLQQQQSETAVQNRLDSSTNAALYGAATHNNLLVLSVNQTEPLLDFSRFNPEDYPTEDCDERARVQREKEIEDGIEVPGYLQMNKFLGTIQSTAATNTQQVANNVSLQHQQQPQTAPVQSSNIQPQWPHIIFATPGDSVGQNLLQPTSINTQPSSMHSLDGGMAPRIHSQVDYIHCLVPDLQKITSCGFYWGKMDRYQAEKLLDGKPEGTFLLRDSAQEEFLFSVSFRKYGRSLHARIEQFNHKFSFDSHDPGVYTASTVTGLLEHYKDPSCVMFFEPMLTHPLNRNFCFSLQQLCRATIVSNTTYDNISQLGLPAVLKGYLKEYHYKQKVRVNRFDELAPPSQISPGPQIS